MYLELRSVTVKKILETVVKHYCVWYLFNCNSLYYYFERNDGFGVTLGRVAKGSDNKQPMSLSVSDKTCV